MFRKLILAMVIMLSAAGIGFAKPASAVTFREACFNGTYSTNRSSTVGYQAAAIACALALGVATWGTAIYTSVTPLGGSQYKIVTKPNWQSATSRTVYAWPI